MRSKYAIIMTIAGLLLIASLVAGFQAVNFTSANFRSVIIVTSPNYGTYNTSDVPLSEKWNAQDYIIERLATVLTPTGYTIYLS